MKNLMQSVWSFSTSCRAGEWFNILCLSTAFTHTAFNIQYSKPYVLLNYCFYISVIHGVLCVHTHFLYRFYWSLNINKNINNYKHKHCNFFHNHCSDAEFVNPEHKCSGCKREDVMSVSYCITCDKKLCPHHQQVFIDVINQDCRVFVGV